MRSKAVIAVGSSDLRIARATAGSSRRTGSKRWRADQVERCGPASGGVSWPDQWRSVRTTNAIERLHEEFKRRIKTQTVLSSADTAAMLFWALLASGQINMRKVDGWQSLAIKLIAHNMI
jgi:hypothetical protein